MNGSLRQVFLLLFITAALFNSAQPPQQVVYSYIDTHAEDAVRQMVEYHIPASVTLAQAILESACGTSRLAQRANNHFGIKCHVEWGGDTVRKNDDAAAECFRSYRSVTDSYTDHSLFLVSRPRYRPLFSIPVTDYKSWCQGLKAMGYATFPGYADELIRIIEREGLYQLDSHVQLTSITPLQEYEIIPSGVAVTSLRKWCEAGLLTAPEMPRNPEPQDVATAAHPALRSLELQ
jgi:flagellum-specific peptidoglycan hydrolase FlgJ